VKQNMPAARGDGGNSADRAHTTSAAAVFFLFLLFAVFYLVPKKKT
jgi:hypothetical protein